MLSAYKIINFTPKWRLPEQSLNNRCHNKGHLCGAAFQLCHSTLNLLFSCLPLQQQSAPLYHYFRELSDHSRAMARGISRLPINLCPKLIGTRIRFRSRKLNKPELPRIRTGRIDKTEVTACYELTNKKEETRRKVMVVIDSSQEAKTALHWSLSHAVQPDDTVVLLDVVKPSTIGTSHLLYIFTGTLPLNYLSMYILIKSQNFILLC